jgi:hypothetical protein
MLYLGMDVSKALGLKFSMGKVRSLKGAMNSNVLDASLNIAFGTAGRSRPQ